MSVVGEDDGLTSEEIRGARPGASSDRHRSLVRGNVMAGLFEAVQSTRLGRFEVRRLLGSGAMGAVFEAWDPELARPVAIKVLHATAHARSRARLRREARGLARVRHPNVVTVHEVVEADDRLCLVLELMVGGTLVEWLRSRRSLPEVLQVFAQVCDGLAAAHAQGLVHRDIKPSNIVFDEQGQAKISDFGLASLAQQSESSLTTADDASGSVRDDDSGFAGTPAYAAPEQLRGHTAAPADVFAVSCTLFEAVYGMLPERSGTSPPTRATESLGSKRVPRRVRAAIEAGLTADAAQRPTAQALGRMLRAPGLRSRTWGIAVPLVGAALLIVANRSGTDEDMQCRDASQELSEHWNADVSADVATAFRATGVPYWSAAHASVADDLDTFAHRWAGERQRACRAVQAGGMLSAQSLDARTRCLDRAAQRMAWLATALQDADAAAVERATTATQQLPDPRACIGAEQIAEVDPVGLDLLSEATVAVQLGKTEQGIAAAQRLLADANLQPLHAVAHLVQGRGARDLGDLDGALGHLRAAWWGALRDEGPVASDAALEIARILVGYRGKYADARVWLENGRAKSGDDDHADRARLEIELAYVDAMTGRAQQRIDDLAEWSADVSLPGDTRTRAILVHGIAILYATPERAGESTEMFRRALERVEARYSEDHPACLEPAGWLLTALEISGAPAPEQEALLDRLEHLSATALSGDWEHRRFVAARRSAQARANDDLEASAEILRTALEDTASPDALPVSAVSLLMNLAADELRLTRFDSARARLDRAERMAISGYGPDDYQVGMVQSCRAKLDGAVRDWPAALAGFQRARETIRFTFGEEHNLVVAQDLAIGRAQLALGQLENARSSLQSVVHRWRDESTTPADYAGLTNLALAELEMATGDPVAARAQLTQATTSWPSLTASRGPNLDLWLQVARLEVELGDAPAEPWIRRLRAAPLHPITRRDVERWASPDSPPPDRAR